MEESGLSLGQDATVKVGQGLGMTEVRGIELHTVTLINERREGHGQHDIPFAQVFVMGGCREFPGGGTIKQRGKGMHKIQLFHISFFWE